MNDDKINLCINNEYLTVTKDTLLSDIAAKFQSRYAFPIVLARVNQELRELHTVLKKDCRIEFLTVTDPIGYKVYTRSACFILAKSIYDVLGDQLEKLTIDYAIGNGYYCRLRCRSGLDENLLKKIRLRMDELIRSDLPISKKTMPVREAIELFKNAGMYDKCELLKYRRASSVNIYSIDQYMDYNYGYMAPTTGCISRFDLKLFKQGFVLVLPDNTKEMEIAPFAPSDKLFHVLNQTMHWNDMLEISTVGDLNDVIARHESNELILVQEALQEKMIAEIAEKIIQSPSKRIVLIAGPSSSGKTTFSHRLSVQLKAHGKKPHPIPVDDYFVNREDTPLGEDGRPNYECLGALDIDLFNEHMSALIAGEEVELPEFNFVTGKREYKGKKLRIGADDILVIEGIHCLNEKLTYSLHKDSKFKIYISALTCLNIDDHNRIPTTDVRLIRRIVRDAARRGSSASNTIAMWNSVRRGEEENIFPYQEDADVMFNSALIYELAILKQYAEPLLFSVLPDTPEYDEAKRLLKFLDYFLSIGSEEIPRNSILREFIGGSCFKV